MTTPERPTPKARNRKELTARSESLQEWLARQSRRVVTATGEPIGDQRTFRVSSRAIHLLIQNMVAGLAAAEHSDPDVRAAKEVGSLILEQTLEGSEARQAHDVFELRADHIRGATGAARLGYLAVFGSTLFVYLTGSAAKADVEAATPDDRSNVLIEALREIARQLTDAGRAVDGQFRLRCHFTEESRIARDADHAQALIRTWRHYRVLLFSRGRPYDVSDGSDRMILGILLGQAAEDRDSTVYRLTKGKLASLIADRLPEDLRLFVPFTHGPLVETRTDLATGQVFDWQDDTRIAVVPDRAEVLARLVREVIRRADEADRLGRRHVDWDGLGRFAGQLGILSGDRVKAGMPRRRIDQLASPGGGIRRLLDPRYITAWRTGRLQWDTWTDVEVPGLTEQLEILERDSDGRIKVRAWVSCPIPGDGWGLSTAEWDRLEQIVAIRSERAGRPASGWGYPIVGTEWVSPDGAHQRTVRIKTGGYKLYERPVDQATRPDGRRRGWPRRGGSLVSPGAINGLALHRQIAGHLEALASELEDDVATLEIPAASPGPASDQVLAIQREIGKHEARIGELAELADGAHRTALRFAARDDEPRADQLFSEEDDYREQIGRHRSTIQGLNRQLNMPAPAQPEDAEVDVSTLEAVAAALRIEWKDPNTRTHTQPTVPPPVAAAARSLFRRTFKAWVEGDDHTQIRWTVDCHLPLRDGRTAVRTLGDVITNSAPAVSAHGNPDLIARRYLLEARTTEEIGAEFGIDGSGKKNSGLMNDLKRWLATPTPVGDGTRMIPTADARRIIIDAPADVRRVIWEWKTGTDHAGRVPERWRQHIIATYTNPEFRWFESWAALDWRTHRRVLSHITDQPDPTAGVAVLEAARDLDMTYRKLVELTHHPRGQAGADAPTKAHPPVLARNFTRTSRTDVTDRKLVPFVCPHDDCEGRGAGKGGRDARDRQVVVDHVLFVPENPTGLLCRHCLRPPHPDYRNLRFPPSYNRPWRRKIRHIDGTRSGSTTKPPITPPAA